MINNKITKKQFLIPTNINKSSIKHIKNTVIKNKSTKK